MKRIIHISIVIAIMLSLTTVYAVSDNMELSVNAIVKMVAENNRQACIDDLEIKAEESAVKKAQNDAKFLGDAYGSTAILSNRVTKLVRPLEAEAKLEAAKMTKKDNLRNSQLTAYKAALDILLAQKELEMEKQKLEILKEKYDIIKTKYDKELITENDLRDTEYGLESKHIDIGKVNEKIRSASLKLKKLLNMPLDDTPFDIKDELKFFAVRKIVIDEVVKEAQECNTGIYQKEENLKAKEKTVELMEGLYKAGDTTYDTNILNLETARMDLEEAKINLEVNIRNKYNDLLNQQDKVELAEKYLTLLEKKLKAAEVKYNTGNISREAFLNEKEKFIDAVYRKYAAIHDYNIAKAEFENMTGK